MPKHQVDLILQDTPGAINPENFERNKSMDVDLEQHKQIGGGLSNL